MGKKNKRIVVATMGTFLEWAEFTYYAYIVNEIGALFFPSLEQRLALMAAFFVFALGYFFRPLGAIFFGWLGDTFGRRVALQSSILLMGISSFSIGCLPTYQSIGASAAILLMLCRSLQGFAVSGEFNGSAIYLMEHDIHKPCLAGSWAGFAAALGMMFGSLMSTLVFLSGMPFWAWRVPFFLGALSCFCAVYVRKNFSESPQYLALKTNTAVHPLKILLKNHLSELFQAMMIVAALGVYVYIMNVYYASHLRLYTSLSNMDIKVIVTVAQLLVAVCILIVAMFADRLHDKQLLRLGLKGFFIAAPLVYWLPQTDSFVLILLGQLVYALCNALIAVPLFKVLNDLFPTHVRYSGVSISWGISIAVFGGTAPLVANYLQCLTHYSAAPALYIILAAGMGLWVLHTGKKTDLNGLNGLG